MKRNKIFSLILALVMVLSVGMVSFASKGNETSEDYTDMETVTITKEYKLINEGTKSPAETFEFTIEKTSVTDAGEKVDIDTMPLVTIGNVTYKKGEAGSETASKDITVTLPSYDSVGIYTYTIKETAGKNAGVHYFDGDIKLVVTVIEQNGRIRVAAVHAEEDGGKKTDTFTNIYSAGNLAITKNVTGNLGDKKKYFDVTVTLTGETDKTYDNPYPVTGGKYTGENEATIEVGTPEVGTPKTLQIKDGDTITIKNLPYGVTYTVVEADYTGDGYDLVKEIKGNIDEALKDETITNNKEKDVPTGINLDNLPYIVLLAGAVIGLGALIVRRRKNTEF